MMKHRCMVIALLLVVPVAGAQTGAGEPTKVTAVTVDKTRLHGEIASYDAEGFQLRDTDGHTQRVAWEQLPPQKVFQIHSQLFGNNATAEQWLQLGELLLTMERSRPVALTALQKAARLDPSLSDRVRELRQGTVAPVGQSASRPAGGDEPEEKTEERAGGKPGEDPASAPPTPQVEGRVDSSYWREFEESEQEDFVTELKQFGEKAQEKFPNLQLQETQYFLFYSDLRPNDVAKWLNLLDRMYDRMSRLFAVGDQRDFWRGKALVFVFNRQEDFQRFEQEMYQQDAAANYAGLCHTFGDGYVHISFYKQDRDLDFARVLVHETAHGFLHRYRSPVHVPTWINEGLAEVIETELAPDPGLDMTIQATARAEAQVHGGVPAGFFDAERLRYEEYAIAKTLTNFLIESNMPAYVAFMNAIKDGKDWRQSLREHFSATPEELALAYTQWMGVEPKAGPAGPAEQERYGP